MQVQRDCIRCRILITGCHNPLGASLVVSATMSLVSAVNDASLGAELEFGEECHVTVLIVYPFIVMEEDGTLIVW